MNTTQKLLKDIGIDLLHASLMCSFFIAHHDSRFQDALEYTKKVIGFEYQISPTTAEMIIDCSNDRDSELCKYFANLRYKNEYIKHNSTSNPSTFHPYKLAIQLPDSELPIYLWTKLVHGKSQLTIQIDNEPNHLPLIIKANAKHRELHNDQIEIEMDKILFEQLTKLGI